jgi:hypothetical protein
MCRVTSRTSVQDQKRPAAFATGLSLTSTPGATPVEDYLGYNQSIMSLQARLSKLFASITSLILRAASRP